MPKYRRKPTEIEAVHWTATREAYLDIKDLGVSVTVNVNWGRYSGMKILAGKNQAQGWVEVPVGHWIAKASDDDFYPIDPEVFAATYEVVED